MQATPYVAPPVAPPAGHWMQRALVALFVERRLPYRLARRLDRLCVRAGWTRKTVKAGGLLVRVRRMTVDEQFVTNIIVNREYTPAGFEIGDRNVVVDVGANIGTFSLMAARAARNGRVFAFEPNTDNYQLLQTNRSLNRLDNLVVTHAAVTGVSGRVKLYENHEGGFHSLVDDRAENRERFEMVEALGLKDIFDTHRINRCDVLKLDCEGAEYDILYHFPAAYFPRIRRIVMEYHGEADRTRRQAEADRLVAYLESVGFEILEYKEFVGFRGGFIRAERRDAV